METLGKTLRRFPSLVLLPLPANAILLVVGFVLRPRAAGHVICAILAGAMLAYVYVSLFSGVATFSNQQISIRSNRRAFWLTMVVCQLFYLIFTGGQCEFIWDKRF